jgi:rhamnogalacturonyl hydrolase YesR
MVLRAFLTIAAVAAPAQTTKDLIQAELLKKLPATVIRTAVGVTRQGTPIPALITADDLDYETPKPRLLLIGGLDSSPSSVESVLEVMKWFYGAPDMGGARKQFAVSAVPVGNPDGWAMGTREANGSGGNPARGYPPPGDAYSSPTNPEAAYLWRWIGMHAPDLVIDVRGYGSLGWQMPASMPLLSLRPRAPLADSDELASVLNRIAPAATGTIPAVRCNIGVNWQLGFFRDLLNALKRNRLSGPSPARREIQLRIKRTPAEVARQLADRYGHDLDQPVYIPAVALIGRLRLGAVADVERIVEPYVTGAKSSLDKATGSHLAGHLVFGELAQLTKKPRYTEMVRLAADLGFDEQNAPKASMPFHNEMSDAVFMGCPILAQAGRLTGDARYFDMCLRHFQFMQALDLRPDGLYRHSPLDEAAWGRGNGFPALGLALSLSDLPQEHAARQEMLRAFRALLTALAPHQDATGAWRQVIDHPESYRELTATCMIAFAIARGMRLGWLDRAKWQPALDRAWTAVKARVASDGGLVDVCTSTGKQKSLREYLDRTAILGADPRGGAMALLLATELEGL